MLNIILNPRMSGDIAAQSLVVHILHGIDQTASAVISKGFITTSSAMMSKSTRLLEGKELALSSRQ